MYVACRLFTGPAYTTKTVVRWGIRNPTWNHKAIFDIPPDHAVWARHLSSNSMVLEVWNRPIPSFTKPNNKSKKTQRPNLPVDANDRLVGIATIPLHNHLGFDLFQLASPHTPYPIRDIVSGQNAGFIFLDASIGTFPQIHSLFKLHAVRILQRTWRKILQKRNPPLPKLPPSPAATSTPIKRNRRTAPVQSTPAPQRATSPITLPHHVKTTSVLPREATLSISILQAKIPFSKSFPKSLNTFVVYALPSGIGEPQATCIRYGTANPIWNHSYSTQLVLDQRTVSILHQPHKYVTFEIWHKYDIPQPASRDHEVLLGSAELPLASLLDASKCNSRTRAHVDIYSVPPNVLSIGTLEVEFSLGPSTFALPEQLTSSHEWVINTLTKYKRPDATHTTPANQERAHADYNTHHADNDHSEDLTELYNSTTNRTSSTTHNASAAQHRTCEEELISNPTHNLSHTTASGPNALPDMQDSSVPDPPIINPKSDSEWKWLAELDKELSVQTDLILKTRHAKNMLELDSLLTKLNNSDPISYTTFLFHFIFCLIRKRR